MSVRYQSLKDCHSSADVAAMPHDHIDEGDYSLMSDGMTIWLSEQAKGSPAAQSFAISKYVFDRLLERYEKRQRVDPIKLRMKEHSPNEHTS